MRFTLPVLLVLCLLGSILAWGADEGTWKTAYVKRGFVGNFDAKWAGGDGVILRARVPMMFAGTKARIYVTGSRNNETDLAQLALVCGGDEPGKIRGQVYQALFSGQPTLKLDSTVKSGISDPFDVPITPGLWYVQSQFTSQNYPYAYEVDNTYSITGEGAAEKINVLKARPGIVTRIDVLTTDTRSSVLCYGDSITAGYASTPDAGHRYPDYLAELIKRPTLNLGVNGDCIQYSGGAPSMAGELAGVDTVVFLMGINDIMSNPNFTKDDYVKAAKRVIDGMRSRKIKIYLGTILPAEGYKRFDDNPAKETLRTDINAWIRTESNADGIIDFEAALADPQHPTKLKADCHSGDWLHPNDHGYQLMAEAAAKVLQPAKP